jgi:hypothetical protein
VTVSLLEIFAAARAHAAPLAAESAGYLLLAVADHVAVAPREVRADDVELGSDGGVRLRAARARGGADDGAERAVRRLLERALEVSSSVGPGLRRAAARREAVGLQQLVRELETALIPVNRSAAKRALSRLYRETDRARAQGKLGKLVDDDVESVAAPVVAAVPVVAPVVVAAALPVAPSEPPVAVVELPPVAPATAAPEPAEVLAGAAEFPEEPTPVLERPVVVAAPPLLTLSPPVPAAEELTPEPLIAQGEPALTKPEPVVERARERGNRTPRLGTIVTAQTLPGEEADLTERAPAVLVEEEPDDAGIDIDIVVELEEPVAEPVVVAALQPLLDPEPSCMPDVLMAMVTLHTGIEADEAPTRLREVVTAPREPESEPEPEPESEPEPEPEPEAMVQAAQALPHTPEPEQVDDAWLTQSSLEGVVTLEVDVPPLEVVRPFVSELADPVLHEALTWDPGPVASSLRSPLPPALLIAEPLPEPSPYAPAVLPARSSDVSELLDSFYVTGAAEERDLRGALKEMAGLELTPMPHPLVEEG